MSYARLTAHYVEDAAGQADLARTASDSAPATDTASRSLTLTRTAADTATATDTTTSDAVADNLLPNTSFELDANSDGLADGLSKFGTPTTAIVTTPVQSGTKAQKITVANGLNEDVRWATVAITAQQPHTLSAYVKVNSLNTGANFVLKVEWLDATDVLVNYDYTTVGAVDAALTRRTVTSTPGAGATKARVFLAIEGGGEAVIDAAQLEVGTAATAWVSNEADWAMQAVMTETDAVGAGGAIGWYIDKAAIRPYEAGFAAVGLAAAYRKWGIASYADAVWNWCDWYAAHQEPDGTMYDYDRSGTTLTKLTTRDSTDAYAGLFLLAVRAANLVDPRPSRLAALQTAVGQAVAAVELTQTSDGLTWAKPEFHAKYLMDQDEAVAGLWAAVEVASSQAVRERARAVAVKQLAGVDALWNPATPTAAAYDWAVSDVGVHTVTTWATLGDALQQAWTVLFRIFPSSRHSGLTTQFDASQPNADKPALSGRYDALVGLAFTQVGDTTRARQYWRNVRTRAVGQGRAWDYNPMKAAWVTLTQLDGRDLLQTAPQTLARVAADTAVATDTISRAATFPRSVTDPALATDAGTRSLAVARPVSDTASAADAATRTVTAARSATDAVPATDAATRSLTTARTAADTAAITDTVTGQLATARTAADAASATDTAARAAQVFARAAADTASAADAPARSLTQSRAVSDGAAATDSASGTVTPAGGTGRSAADTAPATDSADRQVALARVVADGATTPDVITRSVFTARSAADLAAAADVAARSLLAAGTAADTATAGDTASAGAALARSVTDAAPATTTAARALVFARVASDTATGTDTATGAVIPAGAPAPAARGTLTLVSRSAVTHADRSEVSMR